MIYIINNCIRAFGYTNFDRLIEDMGSVDNLKAYVIANGYADIAVAEDTELLLVDVNGKTWHTGCYGAQLGPEPDYLCFTSTGDSTVAMAQEGTPNKSANKVIQYRLNNGQWQNWNLSAVTLADGDKMYLKSDDEIPISEAQATYKMFVMSGSIAASGNIMSLVNFSDTLTDYAFYRMFRECTSLTQAPELPATTLSRRCYNEMFIRCSSLTQAPVLPATTLASECYMFMFSGCTSLTTAPALPANRLTYMCYYNMFKGCTLLTQAPALPATTLAEQCYREMFRECTSLVQAPELPATSLSPYCYESMFYKCRSLTTAPELPAKNLFIADNCYAKMFGGCTSLTQAPALPATTLASSCYASMFYQCSALTQAPALPAITLKKECYFGMFYGCNLTAAPALPATTLALGCYHNMFYECTALTQAPELPATTLEAECYENMFTGCTSLTQAPELPATTLQRACYFGMFENCISLTTAPELPATKLDGASYNSMFKNCQKLKYVKAMFTDTQYLDSSVGNWLSGVSPTGTFVKNSAATWTNEQAGIPTGWTVQVEGGVTPEPEPERDYLCFTSTGDSTVAMQQYGTPNTSANKVIQYKLNDGQWQTWDLSAVTLADGDKMYLKSDDEIPMCEADNIYKKFNITGSIAASGNIMSLLNFSDTLTEHGFYKLFRNCTSLTAAPELPATKLEQKCYYWMFHGCKNLNYVKAMFTDISATNSLSGWLDDVSPTGTFVKNAAATWTNEQAGIPTGWTVQVEGGVTPEPEPERDYLCFTSTGDSTVAMHQEGQSDNKVIQYKLNDGQWQTWDLSPVSLADGDKMYLKSDDDIPMASLFGGNKEFTMTGNIAASGNIMSLLNFSTTLSEYVFYKLFNNCTSLTQAPELPATTLGRLCYFYMFNGCTSLTTAPALPATTLASDCYNQMFNGCTSLTQAPELPATTLASNCYNRMFSNCSSLTQAPALPATTLAESCYNSMFYGCTSLTTAPELPATTLANYCYQQLFSGCSNLNYVKAMFTDVPSEGNPVSSWLNNVSSTGTFVKNSAATWTNEQAGIPTGWTVQTASPDK